MGTSNLTIMMIERKIHITASSTKYIKFVKLNCKSSKNNNYTTPI